MTFLIHFEKKKRNKQKKQPIGNSAKQKTKFPYQISFVIAYFLQIKCLLLELHQQNKNTICSII